MIAQVIRLTNQSFVPVIQISWISIILGCLIIEIPNQIMHSYQREVYSLVKQHGSTSDLTLLMIQFCLQIFSLLLEGYIVFVTTILTHAVYSKTKPQLVELSKSTLVPLTVEGLRALGRMMVGTVLFILPGLYLYLRYSQILYIVLFSPAYKNGKVDALKMSHYLTKGREGTVILFLLVSVGCGFFSGIYKDSNPPLANPLGFTIYFLVHLVSQVYLSVASYFLYLELLQEKKSALPEEI